MIRYPPKSLSVSPRPPAMTEDQIVPSSDRPMLLTPGNKWVPYDPHPMTIVVIGPGAGTRANFGVYEGLRGAGYNVEIVHGGGHDQYPPGWEDGNPDARFNHGNNLAALADDIVYTTIAGLVRAGRGPAVVVAGSRGGQVTTPRMWKYGWRGPTVVINAGCVMPTRTVVPAPPVRLALLTFGRDFFPTKDKAYTQQQLKGEEPGESVLLYHNVEDAHMPASLGGGVLQRTIELARDGFGDTSGPWPRGSTVQLL